MGINNKYFYLTIITILFFTFVGSACTFNSDNVINTCDGTINSKTSFQESFGYQLNTKTICTKSNIDIVALNIPQLTSDQEDFSSVNNLIYEQVCNYIFKFSITDLFLSEKQSEIDFDAVKCYDSVLSGAYNITYKDNEKLSIVFNGIYNMKNFAHPTNYSFCINVNLQNKQIIDLKSMYKFDKEFIDLFCSNMDNWITNSEKKAVISYLNSNFIEESFENDNIDIYYTEKGLGIIINNLPYALGDYCIFEIPDKYIAQYSSKE